MILFIFTFYSVFLFLYFRQASEQYFTSSQTAFHFFRHINGRWQVIHILVGKLAFFNIKITGLSHAGWPWVILCWSSAARNFHDRLLLSYWLFSLGHSNFSSMMRWIKVPINMYVIQKNSNSHGHGMTSQGWHILRWVKILRLKKVTFNGRYAKFATEHLIVAASRI